MSLFMSIEEVLTVEAVLVAVGNIAPELRFIIIYVHVSQGWCFGLELLHVDVEAS